MDYSLLMFVVIKPFRNVECDKTFKPLPKIDPVPFSPIIEQTNERDSSGRDTYPSPERIADSEGTPMIELAEGTRQSIVRKMSDDLFEEEPDSEPQRKKSLQQTVLDLKKMDADKQDGVLYLSESKILLRRDPLAQKIKNRYKSPVFNGKLLVMKQRVKKNVKVFHVCDNQDIQKLKAIE